MNKFESIHLNKEYERPLYLQLYQNLVEIIETGLLKEGEKLPPIRKLAETLGVNRVTVINAYKLLEAKGYVKTKIGSGTYVNFQRRKEDIEVDIDKRDIRYNFASAFLSPYLFPVEKFKEAIIKVLDTEGGYAFEYQESDGWFPLREAINELILKRQEIDVNYENIHIVSGGQQGIEIVAKALLNYQDVVYVESPTYPGAISVFKSRSAKMLEVPIREDGIDVDELAYKVKNIRPKLLYIMPNFQNPTGYSYSERKKKLLIELAKEYNFWILEDDQLNEIYYLDKPTPLKAVDVYDRVFYIKSFSKSVMPGLRLGFIVSPREYREKISEIKYLSDISSSSLEQKAFNIFLRSGDFDEHIQKVRTIFCKKWEIVSASLRKYMGQNVSYVVPKGGLYVWMSLPKGYYSRDLYHRTLERDVIFMPGDLFFPEQSLTEYFRISFAQIQDEDIETGIEILSECIEDFLQEPYHRRTVPKDYRIFI